MREMVTFRPTRVCYGARGESLVIESDGFWVWNPWAQKPGLQVRRATLTGQLLAVLFVAGGEQYLRVRGLLPEGADLPSGEPTEGVIEHTTQVLPSQNLPLAFTQGAIVPYQGPAVLPSQELPLAFTADGQAFLQPWYDAAGHWLVLVTLNGERVQTFPWTNWVDSRRVALSPDGRWLVLVGEAGVVVYDVATGQADAPLERTRWFARLALSPDGRLLVTSEARTVRLWDIEERRCVARLRPFRTNVEALAFSRDGRLLAAGSRDGATQLWEPATGREATGYNWQRGGITDLAFSLDGLTAAACYHQGSVVVWDLDA